MNIKKCGLCTYFWTFIKTVASVTILVTFLLIIYSFFHLDKTVSVLKFLDREQSSINPLYSDATNVKIDRELKVLREIVKSERATLSRLHDGTRDLQGIHLIYISRTNEVDEGGIEGDLDKEQNIPSSVYSTILKQHINGQCYVKDDINPNGSSLEQFNAHLGVKALIKCPLYDTENNLIGIVGVEYTKTPDPDALHTYIERVKLFAANLQCLINS